MGTSEKPKRDPYADWEQAYNDDVYEKSVAYDSRKGAFKTARKGPHGPRRFLEIEGSQEGSSDGGF